MTLGLKLLLWLNGKLFVFTKTSFRYYGLLIYSCEAVGKGVCITRMALLALPISRDTKQAKQQ